MEGGRTYPHAITRQKIENVLGPVDWIATKLHGGHRHSINLLPENNETTILNQIERFASQFPDKIQGYEFILEYTSRAHQKARFMDRVQRYINGEQVKFTANEMQMILKIQENKSKI